MALAGASSNHLELKTALSWREDVEAALDRLLAGVRVQTLAGVAHP